MGDTETPRRLQDGLSIQDAGAETLIYDERRHRAFCLNATSAAVWRICDGAHSVTQIAQSATLAMRAPVTEEIVVFALQELQRDGLLEFSNAPIQQPRLERREMIRKLGTAAAVMLPAIASLSIPRSAQALSGVVSGSRRGKGEPAPAPEGQDSDSR